MNKTYKATTSDIEAVLSTQHIYEISSTQYHTKYGTVEMCEELPEFEFIVLKSSDPKTINKKNNALVFSIDDFDAVAQAVDYTNEKSNGQVVRYEIIHGSGLSGFPKHTTKNGAKLPTGVGITFLVKDVIETFIDALFNGSVLDNPLHGYFLNSIKINDVESLLRDSRAFSELLVELEKKINPPAGQSELSNHIIHLATPYAKDVLTRTMTQIPLNWPEFEAGRVKETVTEVDYKFLDQLLAMAYSSANVCLENDFKAPLGEIENEYFSKRRVYCFAQEMLQAICVYVMTNMMFLHIKEGTPAPKHLQTLFNVPSDFMSMQQIAFFLECKQTSLSKSFAYPCLEKSANHAPFKSLVTHVDGFGKRSRYLPMRYFHSLLSCCGKSYCDHFDLGLAM